MVVKWMDWRDVPEEVVDAMPRDPWLGEHVCRTSTMPDGRLLLAYWDQDRRGWSHYALVPPPLLRRAGGAQ